jgi:hypothetical protein
MLHASSRIIYEEPVFLIIVSPIVFVSDLPSCPWRAAVASSPSWAEALRGAGDRTARSVSLEQWKPSVTEHATEVIADHLVDPTGP